SSTQPIRFGRYLAGKLLHSYKQIQAFPLVRYFDLTFKISIYFALLGGGWSQSLVQLFTHTTNDVFSFIVIRKSTGRRLFDTSLGWLLFKITRLRKKLFKHDFTTYTTWGMLARDEPPSSAGLITKNLYGKW
ncbi:unnamed protein product, partial [Strongylus vulgaris]